MHKLFKSPVLKRRVLKSTVALAAIVVAMLVSLRLTYSAEPQRLSVFTPGQAIQLPIVEQAGAEYIALTDVLDRLGTVTSSIEGLQTRIGLNGVEAEFTANSPAARIGSQAIQISGGTHVESGKLLLPLDSLEAVLQHFTDTVEFHRASRRLFIGPVKQLANPELKRADSTLSLYFPAPVSPVISTDGSRLRMVFSREPIVMSSDRFDYTDSVIQSVAFLEGNGTAEIAVQGSSPLLATFADGGSRIDVTAALAGATPQRIAPSGAVSKSPAHPGFLVVIDAAHGGPEPGVRFSDKLVEKDVALAVARKLLSELQNKGVSALLLRNDDSAMSLDSRVVLANQRRASIYVSVHAGTLGSGVRVYSPLTAAADTPQPALFVPWDSAQRASFTRSRMLASSMRAALNAGKIKAESFTAAIPPLTSIAAPAVAIEIAPETIHAATDSLESAKYQDAVAEAAAAGIVSARAKIEASR